MKKIFFTSLVLSIFVLGGLSGHSYAANINGNQGKQNSPQGHFQENKQQKPGVAGSVLSVSGYTLTVASKGFEKDSATTTYTVDASNAIVMKDRATSTVSSISVGSFVMVEGTVSGTSIVATKISLDNGFRKGVDGDKSNIERNASSSKAIIEGDGNPIIGGTVSNISGTNITVKNKSDIIYTVDTSNAIFIKNNATSSISNISVGDSVLVQGTISGTSVVASSVTDHGNSVNATSTKSSDGKSKGFWGGVGNFFSRLFGF